MACPVFRWTAWVQGSYFLITGIWPLVSIESFQAVTGRKTDHIVTGCEGDHWLVMTVGVLITAISITLLIAAWRRQRLIEIAVLGLIAAIGLTTIDVIYVARDVLSPIYLGDAAVEIPLIVGWLFILWSRH